MPVERPMEMLWPMGQASLKALNTGPVVVTGRHYLEKISSDLGIAVDFPFEDGDFVANERELFRLSGEMNRILFFREAYLPFFAEMVGFAATLYRMKEICRRANPTMMLIVRSAAPLCANESVLQQAVEDAGCVYWPCTLCDGIVHMELWKEIGQIEKSLDLYRRSIIPNLKTLVECNNLSDGITAIKSGADGVVLKGVRAEIASDIARGLRERFKKAYIEYCGSIDMSTIEEFARTGMNALGVMDIQRLWRAAPLDVSFFTEGDTDYDGSSS